MEPILWCITFEYIDGGIGNVFSIGVDMDVETAEHLVVEHLRDTFDEEYQPEVTMNDLEIGEIYWVEVPDEIDNFYVVLEEKE